MQCGNDWPWISIAALPDWQVGTLESRCRVLFGQPTAFTAMPICGGCGYRKASARACAA